MSENRDKNVNHTNHKEMSNKFMKMMKNPLINDDGVRYARYNGENLLNVKRVKIKILSLVI